MHHPNGILAQFDPLMRLALAQIHALETAARGARPGQAGDDFVRLEQWLAGALMIGSGLLGFAFGAFFGFPSDRISLFLGLPEGAVLGRRLVGVGGILIQAVA